VPNHERVQAAIMTAIAKVDKARLGLDPPSHRTGGPGAPSSSIRAIKDAVREALAAVQSAEQLFSEELDRKAHLDREADAATKELQEVELRLDLVASQIEVSGPVVAHLAEEAYSQAENSVANAKKLLRKGAGPGDIRFTTQRAIDAVRLAEDSLEKHRRQLQQLLAMREAEQAKLDGAASLLNQVSELCDEMGLGEQAGEVSGLVETARSSVRLAQSRLTRAPSVAWVENREVQRDQAVVKEALNRVDDVEDQVYKEKALLEKLDREARVNLQLLELGLDKFEALHAMAMDEGLGNDLQVQSVLEEANDSLSFAKKAHGVETASGARVLSSRRNIDAAVAKVTKAEEAIFAAKTRRDEAFRGKQEASARVERVMAELQAVVATIDAAGPAVSSLMEDRLDAAAKAVNAAVRHLRNDKDIGEFRGPMDHAADLVASLDEEASKVRMQATKAEKLKLQALKRLEQLQGQLNLVSDKADSQGLRFGVHHGGVGGVGGGGASAATAASLVAQAESTLALMRRRADGSVEQWMQSEGGAMQRGLLAAAEAVQRAEEAVEDEADKRDRKRKVREKLKQEMDDLTQQLARVREEVDSGTHGGLASSSNVQLALSAAETELDGALHAFQTGAANMVGVATTAEAIHHLQELADAESRKRSKRHAEITAALRELPHLQQQIAAVEALVESSGPPVGLLVEPDLTHAVSSVMELERFVDAGHDYAPSRPPPSVQAAKDKCQALEELALRQVKRVNAAHQSIAHEQRRLDDLQARFSEVCEVVGAFCSRSDHLRIQLEAQWQDICWWGSQARHARAGAALGVEAFGRGELKPIGAVEALTEQMMAADRALGFARKKVEASVEQWLEAGPAAAHNAVDDAALKVDSAQSLVDREEARLEHEEKRRANAMGELRAHADRLGSVRALMEANSLAGHALCKEALRAAEHACAVVGDLLGKGAVNGAAPALEVAVRKVGDVHDMVVSEAQRRSRLEAEREHATSKLAASRAQLQAVQDTHAALGMGQVAFVADAVHQAAQALREAELLASADQVGLSLVGRAVGRVQQLLEVAERAVGQQKRRQEDLARFHVARVETVNHRRLRRDYKEKLKARAEQGERARMETELGTEALKLDLAAARLLAPSAQGFQGFQGFQGLQGPDGSFSFQDHDDRFEAQGEGAALPPALKLAAQAVHSARVAIAHANLPAAQRAVREAQVKIRHALQDVKSPDHEEDLGPLGRAGQLDAEAWPPSPGGSPGAERGIEELEAEKAQLRRLEDLNLPMVAGRFTQDNSQDGGGGDGDVCEEAKLGDRSQGLPPHEEEGVGSMFPTFPPGCFSLLTQWLTPDLYHELSPLQTASGVTLQDCIICGVEHPDHPVGLVAGDAECYELFAELFEPIVQQLHNYQIQEEHPPLILDAGELAEFTPAVAAAVSSCRVSLTRSVAGLSLPPQMTSEQRKELAATVAGVLGALEGTALAADTFTLQDAMETPEVGERLVLVLGADFKEAAGPSSLPRGDDPYRESAGLREEWPADRSVLVGRDSSFSILVNGDEHLVLTAKHDNSLLEAFNQVADLADNMGSITPEGSDVPVLSYLATSRLGFVTADPKALGTAMRVQVQVNLKNGKAAQAVAAAQAGALQCSQEALAAVEVVAKASSGGGVCVVRSTLTLGATVAQTLSFVGEVVSALVTGAV